MRQFKLICWLGNFRLDTFVIEPSLREVRLGTFAWYVAHWSCRSRTPSLNLSLENFCFGCVAWELSLGCDLALDNFRFGHFRLIRNFNLRKHHMGYFALDNSLGASWLTLGKSWSKYKLIRQTMQRHTMKLPRDRWFTINYLDHCELLHDITSRTTWE